MITAPLNAEGLRKHEKDGIFQCRLMVDLSDLIGQADIDDFNNFMESLVIAENTGCFLNDIGYAVVGHRPPEEPGLSMINGEVMIEVTAVLKWRDDEDEDEDEN